ncbi:unnamed protein product [Amoebophrya sp. A25]|nr:unnamed protein product [Amoebophrya sp. A25]|eukprot:GSA25T00023074001.1
MQLARQRILEEANDVEVDIVLLVHPGRTLEKQNYDPMTSSSLLAELQKPPYSTMVKIKRVPWTIPPSSLFDKGNAGWCGEQDLVRLHALALTDYHAIAYYDSDVELRGSYTDLFHCVDGMDVVLTTTGGIGEPLNVGFFALKPKTALLEAAKEFSMTATFEPKKGGWANAGFWPSQYYFIGAECGQGYWLTFFYRLDNAKVQAAYKKAGVPLDSVRAASIDRCVWNYQTSSGCETPSKLPTCELVRGHHKPAEMGSDAGECLKKGLKQLRAEKAVALGSSSTVQLSKSNLPLSATQSSTSEDKQRAQNSAPLLPDFLRVQDFFASSSVGGDGPETLRGMKNFVSLGPLPQRMPWPVANGKGLPAQCDPKRPEWLVREDRLLLDVNAHKVSDKVRALAVVTVIEAAGADDWGKPADRPNWSRTLLAATLQHLRQWGHGLVARTQFTDQRQQSTSSEGRERTRSHLQDWQRYQCSEQKKSAEQCEKDFQRENFNWEKHLMLADYLNLKEGKGYRFTHVAMLDGDLALVNRQVDSLGLLAWHMWRAGKSLFMANEDWLKGEDEGAARSHARRGNGGFILATGSFGRKLFLDSFDAHVHGNGRGTKGSRGGAPVWPRLGIRQECSSNEQLCLSDIMYSTSHRFPDDSMGPSPNTAVSTSGETDAAPGSNVPGHQGEPRTAKSLIFLGSGTFWNRGRSPQKPGMPDPDARLHVLHYMGGGRQQSLRDLCSSGGYFSAVGGVIGSSARKVLKVCRGGGSAGEGSYTSDQRTSLGGTEGLTCKSQDKIKKENADSYPPGARPRGDPWPSWIATVMQTTNKEKLFNSSSTTSTGKGADQQVEPSSTAVPSSTSSSPSSATPEAEDVASTSAPPGQTTQLSGGSSSDESTSSGGNLVHLSYQCCDKQQWHCCGESGMQIAAQRKKNDNAWLAFYIHLGERRKRAAVTYLVARIAYFHPGAVVYIVSDGADRFERYCDFVNRDGGGGGQFAPLKCLSASCPPAEDRWHPWPFFRRFWDAASAVPQSVEYLVYLEPDVTMHTALRKEHMTEDAGGILDHNGLFSDRLVNTVEQIARKNGAADYRWKYRGTGLAGGSYYKKSAILSAFSDEASKAIDWGKMFRFGPSAAVYSSDFAMPIALAHKGLSYKPWPAVRQAYGSYIDREQPGNATVSLIHYNRDIQGGKPDSRLQLVASAVGNTDSSIEGGTGTASGGVEFRRLQDFFTRAALQYIDSPNRSWSARAPNICQLCWNLAEYKRRFGTSKCAPNFDYVYTPDALPKDARPGERAAVMRMR